MHRAHNDSYFYLKVLKGGKVIEPLKDLIAMKRHIKAEKERHEEEEREKTSAADTPKNDSHSNYGRGFSKPFTGTIPFDLTWTTKNIEKKKIGSLESYQPFIPPLNYKLDELVPKPNVPDVFRDWKNFNFLENAEH